MPSLNEPDRIINWQTRALNIVLVIDESGCVRFRSLLPSNVKQRTAPGLHFDNSDLPLASIRLAGQGNTADPMVNKTAKSLIGSYASTDLRYQHHEVHSCADYDELTVHCEHPPTAISVSVHFTIYKGIPVLRSFVEVCNKSSSKAVTITQLSSLTIGGLTRSSKEWFHDYNILTANNGWFREAQWHEQSLPDVGIDNDGILELEEGQSGSQATFGLSNHSSFSTGSYLPMGILKARDNCDTWLWQIEHNGSWRWEIGDLKDSVYLAAGGPTSVDHNCKILLSPGEVFRSAPVACCHVNGGVEAAFAALTDYRRAIRRPHPDNEDMPIIFNDYMNCLMGDPDEHKISALLEPVKRAGAEYFVIDAGWYADDSNWWDDVGLWEPSKKRFPSGFKNLLDTIRSNGLIPGLWLEPEVVGVRSVMAERLPEDAFFHENGERVMERGRFQLDYRHAEVIKWMDSVIHRLVEEYGARYFKFDYNIEVVQGTDVDTKSPGAAHLAHQRAYLTWIRSLLDSYPGLVIENCSSGAQRMDYGMLSVHPLQSTSDQQDPYLYAAIAAAVPTAVTPEQSATWAYPQPDWDDEKNAFTVVNCLLGRVHLSGRLDRLNSAQFDLITEGMQVYKEIRRDLRHAKPIWPLGLPKWHDGWVCLGMVTQEGHIYLSVWRRHGPMEMMIPIPVAEKHQDVKVRLLYPSQFPSEHSWIQESTSLCIKLPDRPCARLFKLVPEEQI